MYQSQRCKRERSGKKVRTSPELQFAILLSRTLNQPLDVIFDMDVDTYELYKAEFVRCPWDQTFRQTEASYTDTPDSFLEKISNA